MSALEWDADQPAIVDAALEDGQWLVRFTGELDLATRDGLEQACLQGGDAPVMVDLKSTWFMDCGG